MVPYCPTNNSIKITQTSPQQEAANRDCTEINLFTRWANFHNPGSQEFIFHDFLFPQDGYTDKHGSLHFDRHQDYTLDDVTEGPEGVVLTFHRLYDTCDKDDYLIDVRNAFSLLKVNGTFSPKLELALIIIIIIIIIIMIITVLTIHCGQDLGTRVNCLKVS